MNFTEFISSASNEIITQTKNKKIVIVIGKNSTGKSSILAEVAKMAPEYYKKTLALSFTVSDKFSFRHSENYVYLGVRSSGNATYVNSIDTKIFESLVEGYALKGFHSKFENICEFLGITPKANVVFSLRNGFQKQPLIPYLMNSWVKRVGQGRVHWKPLAEASDPYSPFEINNFYEHLLKTGTSLGEIEHLLGLFGSRSRFNNIEVPIELIGGQGEGVAKAFSCLRQMGVIKNLSISIGDEANADFSWLSSGQKSILFTLTQAIKHAHKETLILIDEPEISLHPEWQANYIKLIENIFEKVDCKFVIATHSPYVAINCKTETSGVLSIRRDSKCFYWEPIASMEGLNIDVASVDGFGVSSTRSAYFERILIDACAQIVSKKPDIAKVSDYIKAFNRISIRNEDPLNSVIEELNEIINRHENNLAKPN